MFEIAGGHTSIPKHLRDIIVTEYGIAEIRGKADAQIIEEILNVTDSRFQGELIRKAKRHGKLASDFELAPEYRQNYPERLQTMLKPFQIAGHFVPFPFGTDFTPEELVIGGSLKAFVKKKKPDIVKGIIAELFQTRSTSGGDVPEKNAAGEAEIGQGIHAENCSLQGNSAVHCPHRERVTSLKSPMQVKRTGRRV